MGSLGGGGAMTMVEYRLLLKEEGGDAKLAMGGLSVDVDAGIEAEYPI